jgi:hypothetical protein
MPLGATLTEVPRSPVALVLGHVCVFVISLSNACPEPLWRCFGVATHCRTLGVSEYRWNPYQSMISQWSPYEYGAGCPLQWARGHLWWQEGVTK